MRKSNFWIIPLFSLILGILPSCLDEFESDSVIVSSEELIFVSAERVALLGRLHSATGTPDAFGFEIAEDASFSAPVIVPAETEPELGAFVARYNELSASTDYFARAYVTIGGETTLGEVISFTSLNFDIASFEPNNGRINSTVVIIGSNLSSDTKVFFGDVEARVNAISLESRIEVSVPTIGDSDVVSITVESDGSSLVFEETFTYHTGSWEKVGQYPNDLQLVDPVILDLDNSVVIGYGKSQNTNALNTDFFRLDKSSLAWTQIAPPVGSTVVEDAINFATGFGSGTFELGFAFLFQSNESWTYDESSSSWQSNGILPFGLSNATAARLNGEDFVFGGLNEDVTENLRIWKKSVDGTWSAVAASPFPITREEAHFTYNNKFYYQSDNNSISEFDPETLTWNLFYSSSLDLGNKGVGVVIGDRAFVGLGEPRRDLIQINMNTRDAVEKNLYPGIVAERNVAAWAFGGNLYILRTALTNQASTSNIENMEIWTLDPDALN